MDTATQSSHATIGFTIRKKFIDILGTEHLRPATPADSVSGVQPQLILEPATELQLAAALRLANEASLAVIPRGGGTKLAWGNPLSRADLILSTVRLNKILEHAWADLTVTVEAGCSIQTLQETLAQHGQRLALDPLWPEKATVGGILSTNDSGALRLRFGALRDLIIGVTIALPDGTLASSGGKVVKNVAGYDLPKLATGALGTLGIITRAIFRLHPIAREIRSLSFSPPDTQAMNAFLLAILDSKLVPTGLQFRAGSSLPLQVDIRFEGTTAGCDAQCEQILKIAASCSRLEVRDAWAAAERLWDDAPCVVKFSTLPAELGALLDRIKKLTDALHLSCSVV